VSEKTVGLLSPGAMGSVVGRVLIEHGVTVLTCLEDRGPATRERAREAGIDDVPSYADLVSQADLVLSILVPSETTKASERVAAALQQTRSTISYVDCNAVAPRTARSLADTITAAGSRFVDAGIIGGPPTRPGITRFYASGEDAAEFESLASCGLDIRVMGTKVGQASGFKMCYASQTKGRYAIFIQSLVAAHKMGFLETLVQELQASQSATLADAERNLPGIPSKAGRWIGEMEEIAGTFEDLGLSPLIFGGAADVYRLVDDATIEIEQSIDPDRAAALKRFLELMVAKLP